MRKILIIEDEKPIADLIRLNLTMAGFATEQASDGRAALKLVQSAGFDLALLDVMLPGQDGFDLLPRITARGIPVIFVTAKDSLKDRVGGLEGGADDYIVKPFEGTELVARVKAVLRRRGKSDQRCLFEDIEVDFASRRVLKDGREVELTLKEFELLKCLIDNKNIAVSREDLLKNVWEYQSPGNTRTVDIHVQKLRSKLRTDAIKTVFKLGYRLEL
jgi:two-component system alkaline phosphatase synthesis response regulator PhoP